MVCLGLEPGAAGWKAQTNPLSYGSTPSLICLDTVVSVHTNSSKFSCLVNSNPAKLETGDTTVILSRFVSVLRWRSTAVD